MLSHHIWLWCDLWVILYGIWFWSLIHVAVQALRNTSYHAATLRLLFVRRKYCNVRTSNNLFSSPEATEPQVLDCWITTGGGAGFQSSFLIYGMWAAARKKKWKANITCAGLQVCLKFRPSQRFHTLTTGWLKEPPETVNLLCQCFVLLNPLTHVKIPSSQEA